MRLGRRHPAVAGADDLVHARHRAGAVGHGRHGVRAADAEQAIDTRLERRGEHRGVRPRARDDHLGHAGRPRGNRGHQQRRGQGIAARRHVAADARERHHALLDGDAWPHRHAEALRHLRLRHPPDAGGGVADGAAHGRRHRAGGGFPFVTRHLDRPRQAVELPGVGGERAITALAHALDDGGGGGVGGAIPDAGAPTAVRRRPWCWTRQRCESCWSPTPRSC